MKKIIISVILIYIIWSILDFLIHGVLLVPTYEATAELWRSKEEMKMGLMQGVTVLIAILFVTLYSSLTDKPSLGSGLKFGILMGLILGTSMGFGTYCYMPIPMSLALSWFAVTLVEMVIAGGVVGGICRKKE